MRFFIASGRSNTKQIKNLIDNLHSLGHEAESFIPQDNDAAFTLGPGWRQRTELKTIFEAEMTRIEEADRFILLLPAGKNSHLAAGVAYGFGKHLTLIGEPKLVESHYLIFDDDYKSIEDFVEAVRTRA